MDPDLTRAVVETSFEGNTVVLFRASLLTQKDGETRAQIRLWAEDITDAIFMARQFFLYDVRNIKCYVHVAQINK